MKHIESIEPIINNLNAPFWDAATRGELVLPWCAATRKFYWPPAPVSPFSLDTPISWRPAETGGTLQAAVTYRRSYLKVLDPIMPYSVGIVELDAGPRLQVHLRDGNLALPAQHGQRVQIYFEGLLPDSRPVPMARAV